MPLSISKSATFVAIYGPLTATVRQIGHAHPAGQLKPCLGNMNGHSPSAHFVNMAIDADQPRLILSAKMNVGACQSTAKSQALVLTAQGGLPTPGLSLGQTNPLLSQGLILISSSSPNHQIIHISKSVPKIVLLNIPSGRGNQLTVPKSFFPCQRQVMVKKENFKN